MTATGGIFAHRAHGPGRAFLGARKAKTLHQLADFAEALAGGATVGQAAASIGVCGQRGSQLLAQIRRELGWKAS